MRNNTVRTLLGAIFLFLAIVSLYDYDQLDPQVFNWIVHGEEQDKTTLPESSASSSPSFPKPLSDTEMPIFSRHEVNTGVFNGVQVLQNCSDSTLSSELVRGRPDYKDSWDNQTDIHTVTYFSADGNTINGTLWMREELPEVVTDPEVNTIVYGILIDSDNNKETGKQGVDFQKEVQWNSELGNWSTLFVEFSSEYSRTISIESNSTVFFGEDQNYVLLPLELDSITSPGSFSVLYYTVVIYNPGSQECIKTVLDLSDWIDIPPITYSFSTIPSSIELRQGEEKEIGLQLQSSTGAPPNSISYVLPKNLSQIDIQAINLGVQPASFKIRAAEGANIGEHTIPILANISSGTLFSSGFIELPGINLPLPAENYFTSSVGLTL